MDTFRFTTLINYARFLDLLRWIQPHLSSPCKLTIDMERVTFAHASGVVPMIALVHDLTCKGWQFDLVYPDDEMISSYFDLAGWTHGLNEDFGPPHRTHRTLVQLTKYDESRILNQRISESLDVLARMTEYPPGVLQAIEWTLNEVADNVLNHAGVTPGWFQLVSEPNHGRVEMVIVDRGRGIRGSLSEGYPDLSDDQEALRLAIQKGVTRDKKVGQGNGLSGSISIASAAGGWLNLLSGVGSLRLLTEGRIVTSNASRFDGTVISLTLPTTKSIDVSTALWGHQPISMFEFAHLEDWGISFRVAEEATGFGNRATGLSLATKLRNLMVEMPNQPVVVDFDGVPFVSASFADEFLAKLVAAEGVATFFARVRLAGMTEFVARTINEVVAQRMASE